MKELHNKVLSWASIVDDNTLKQAETTASLPFIPDYVALMPDAHFGKGSTIGSVIPTQGAIIPSAIGVDIGCGMAAIETGLHADRLPDNLDFFHHNIEEVVPAGMGKRHQSNQNMPPSLTGLKAPGMTIKQWETARQQFGTLGGGNHFVEVCLDENDKVWIVLHSGSRGIGNQLANSHIDGAKNLMKRYFIELPDPDLAYFVEGTREFDSYIKAMNWAQDYAQENRNAMLSAILTKFKDWTQWYGTPEQWINCHHNYTTKEQHHGRNVWLTRKGAISARFGEMGIIPGSMGAQSYIVRGLGSEASYQSCSHGASRLMSRNVARKTFTTESLSADMKGKSWNVSDANELLDESPGAYKPIDVVMNDQSDLVEVVHTLRQVINFKGTK